MRSTLPMQYYITYKPFQVLTQFTSQLGKTTLAAYCNVPPDVYPVGRLDFDSEGLLVLSNDASLNQRLLHPSFRHEREYWVQVEGTITPEALRALASGLEISIDGKPFRTRPCIARSFENDPPVPARNPPVRFRKSVPTSWIRLVLTEGKNRQVRRMTAKAGFPTLRLIRYRIGQLRLEDLAPGDCLRIAQRELFEKLFGK